jgi:hypothetical protein
MGETLMEVGVAVIVVAIIVIVVILMMERRKGESYVVEGSANVVRNKDGSVREVLGTKYHVPDDQPYYVQEFVRVQTPTWNALERRNLTGVQHNPAWSRNLSDVPKTFPPAKEWGIDYRTYRPL